MEVNNQCQLHHNFTVGHLFPTSLHDDVYYVVYVLCKVAISRSNWIFIFLIFLSFYGNDSVFHKTERIKIDGKRKK